MRQIMHLYLSSDMVNTVCLLHSLHLRLYYNCPCSPGVQQGFVNKWAICLPISFKLQGRVLSKAQEHLLDQGEEIHR